MSKLAIVINDNVGVALAQHRAAQHRVHTDRWDSALL
jgi:hypothetical protein